MLASLRKSQSLPWWIAGAAVVASVLLGTLNIGRSMVISALEGTVATQNVTVETYRGMAARSRVVSDSTAQLLAIATKHAEDVSRPLRGNGALGNRVIVRRVIEHDTVVRVDTLHPEMPPADTGALTEEQAARALPFVRHSLDSLTTAVQVNAIAVQMERSASALVEQTLRSQLAHERSFGTRAKRAAKWMLVGVGTGAGAVLLLL